MNGTLVRKAGAGQQVAVVRVAYLTTKHICDGGKFPLLIGELQYLTAGKFHTLQGAAQIAKPHTVVIAVGDHGEIPSRVKLVLLFLFHQMQAESGIRLFEQIGPVSCLIIDPAAIFCTGEMLQVHIRQHHCCRLIIYPYPGFDAQEPSGAEDTAFVLIAGLIDTYQAEVLTDVFYNEIGVSNPLAAGYHINGVAAGALLFLRNFSTFSTSLRSFLLRIRIIAVNVISGPILRAIGCVSGLGLEGADRLHSRPNIPLHVV